MLYHGLPVFKMASWGLNPQFSEPGWIAGWQCQVPPAQAMVCISVTWSPLVKLPWRMMVPWRIRRHIWCDRNDLWWRKRCGAEKSTLNLRHGASHWREFPPRLKDLGVNRIAFCDKAISLDDPMEEFLWGFKYCELLAAWLQEASQGHSNIRTEKSQPAIHHKDVTGSQIYVTE